MTQTSTAGSRVPRTSGTRLAVLIIASVLLTGGLAAAVWFRGAGSRPSPESDPATLARFVAGGQFQDMPEMDKRPYTKAVRQRLEEIAGAFREGRIDEKTYFAAYLNAYVERKLDGMEEYFASPATKRDAALTQEYARKTQQAAAGDAKKSAKLSDTLPKPSEGLEDDFIDERVETWPPEQRAKWEEYCRAVDRAKNAAKGGRASR
jgi:uncharacterized membrane protein